MTRELLGRVSKASQELFGQNASLRAPRVFETKTGELLRPDTVPRSTPCNENFHFSSTISPPHIDGNLLSSAFERRTVSFQQVQF
eukprot:COSAG02_NODE_2650_length_8327_cov_247.925620_5_plen_84_part_01